MQTHLQQWSPLLSPPAFSCRMLSVGLRVFPLPSLAHQPSLLGLLWPGVTMSPWADCPYQTGWLPQKRCQHHFSSRYICFPKKTYRWPVSYLPFPPLQSLLSSLLLPESCVVAMVTPLSLKIHFFPQCRLKFLSFTLRRELPPSKVALIEHEMLCS